MKSYFILICLLLIVAYIESRDFNSDLISQASSKNIDFNEQTDLNCSKIQVVKDLEDTIFKDTVLPKPFKLEAICDCNNIIWHWGGVDKAKGYKINFVNDINSATNLFNEISFFQQKLASNKIYNLYVWAYNDSLISEALHIEAQTGVN